MQPPSGLSKIAKKKRQRASPPFFSTCLMGHPLRNFWDKKLTGSCQVKELWRHKGNKHCSLCDVIVPWPCLREIVDYCTLEGDIDQDEASFDHFTSELTCLTLQKCPFYFWSRSGQDQVKVQVSHPGWTYDKFMCCLRSERSERSLS